MAETLWVTQVLVLVLDTALEGWLVCRDLGGGMHAHLTFTFTVTPSRGGEACRAVDAGRLYTRGALDDRCGAV